VGITVGLGEKWDRGGKRDWGHNWTGRQVLAITVGLVESGTGVTKGLGGKLDWRSQWDWEESGTGVTKELGGKWDWGGQWYIFFLVIFIPNFAVFEFFHISRFCLFIASIFRWYSFISSFSLCCVAVVIISSFLKK
jgi:hypothetical protein